MIVDDLVALAKERLKDTQIEYYELSLCEAVIELLAEASPGGWERSNHGLLEGDPVVWVPDWEGTTTPEDAYHLARMLMRSADAARALAQQSLKVSEVKEQGSDGEDESAAK